MLKIITNNIRANASMMKGQNKANLEHVDVAKGVSELSEEQAQILKAKMIEVDIAIEQVLKEINAIDGVNFIDNITFFDTHEEK